MAAKAPSAAVYNDLGLLYAYNGDTQRAQEAFHSALKLQPGNEAANLNLGILLKPTKPIEAAAFIAKAPHLVTTKPTSTSPAITPSASSSTDRGPVLARSPTQIPGLSAELFEFTRFQNTITARVRLINSSGKDQTLPYEPFLQTLRVGYVLDEATGKKYSTSAQSNDSSIIVPANGSLEAWAKFSLPTEDHPQYLSVVGAYGIHFDNVAVQQKP